MNFGTSIGINERNKANEHVLGKKGSHLGKWAIFVRKMVHPHNPGSTLSFFFLIFKKKGSNREMKLILIVFFEKKKLFGAN